MALRRPMYEIYTQPFLPSITMYEKNLQIGGRLSVCPYILMNLPIKKSFSRISKHLVLMHPRKKNVARPI